MILLLLFFLVTLILFNIFIWVYDATKLKDAIQRSKKLFRVGIVITILSYLLLLTMGLIDFLKSK